MAGRLHKEVTYDELCILMTHLVRCEEVLQAAMGRVRDEDFSAAELPFRLLWQITRDFYRAHRRMPPQEYLRVQVQTACSKSPTLNQAPTIESILKMVDFMFVWKELIPTYAQDVLWSFLWQRQVGSKILAAAEKGYCDEPMWNEIAASARAATVDMAPDIMPFSIEDGLKVGVPPRNETGVQFLDLMLNGGTRPGELHGFLAVSGGGKTTISHQLGIHCALKKQHAIIMSYEQPVDHEYFVPVYACATKILREKWERITSPDKIADVLTVEEQDIFHSRCENINKYLHYVDMSGTNDRAGYGGVTEIDAKLEFLKQKIGAPIHMFVVDWFWPLVLRHYDTAPVSFGKKLDIRVYAQGVTDELKRVAGHHMAWCWLTHQLAPKEGQKKRHMSFEDAAELKSFAWFMNGCFCLSKFDKAGIASLDFSKARNQKTSTKLLQLQGDIATFKEISNDMQFDKAEGCYVNTDEANIVPGARKHTDDDSDISEDRRDYTGPERIHQ